jgi:hypothetical protein
MRIIVHEQALALYGFIVFGAFDAESEIVHVTKMASSSDLMSVHPALANLDPAEWYVSVITHEVSHGIIHQSLAGKSLGIISAEYLAFAVQIESMPDKLRQGFLAAFPVSGPLDRKALQKEMLLTDSFRFGVTAYRHIQLEPDMCAMMKSLIDDTSKIP